MDTYTVTLSVPHTGGPTFKLHVEAASEDAAMDVAFEQAFREHPQFGSFQIDAVEPTK